MDPLEIMKARHSVRSYNDRPLDEETLRQLNDVIDHCRQESGLNIQVCLNERQAFDSLMGRTGKFSNLRNYIALLGDKSPKAQENAGYYGEKIVLKATELGLGTCWVGKSYSKKKCGAQRKNGEKLFCVIAFGFSDQTGVPHTTKPISELSQVHRPMPEWFKKGMEAAQLAPTALNHQKFTFQLDGNQVTARAGFGVATKIDLGIAKYHFELGAGKGDWSWASPS